MDLMFDIDAIDLDETLPPGMNPVQSALFLAEEKAKALGKKYPAHILLTADTIVALDDIIFGKPSTEAEAIEMLKTLSGREHMVVTGYCLAFEGKVMVDSDTAYVTFSNLSDADINYYIKNYEPYDKAGGYGIQEWIGVTGITGIRGSYFNVMGLPVEKIYRMLRRMDLLEVI